MRTLLCVLLLVVVSFALLPAQEVIPLSLKLGPMGGVVIPSGTFSDLAKTGWNAGVEGKFGNLIPSMNLTASFTYSQLAFSDALVGTGTSYNHTELLLAAGLEYPFPSPQVSPYIGVDLMYNMLGNNAPNTNSEGRAGIGLGAGVEFSGLDVSAKYQMLNLVGKSDQTLSNGTTKSEDTLNQIAVRVAYLFPVL